MQKVNNETYFVENKIPYTFKCSEINKKQNTVHFSGK